MTDDGVMAKARGQADMLAMCLPVFKTKAISRFRDDRIEITVNLATGDTVIRLGDEQRMVVLHATGAEGVVEFHEGEWVKYLNETYFLRAKEMQRGQRSAAATEARSRAKANDADLFTTTSNTKERT